MHTLIDESNCLSVSHKEAVKFKNDTKQVRGRSSGAEFEFGVRVRR